MRKLALVLVAVLLLMMVGACGGTGPTEGSKQLDKMFTDFIEAVQDGYDDNYHTVIKSIRPLDGPEHFINAAEDDYFYFYAYGYDRPLYFDDLYSTLMTSKSALGETLTLMFTRRDNPGLDSMDDLTKRVNNLCKQAFEDWNKKDAKVLRTADGFLYRVKADAIPASGAVMITMDAIGP